MANDTYTANEDGSCFVGRFNLPSWVRNQAVNTWGVVPSSNTLSDTDPENDPLINPNHPSASPWRGSVGFNGHISAYCGMHYDYVNDELRDVLNGGHQDNGGNNQHGIKLNVESPAWRMIKPPSGGITDEYPSGFVTNDGLESTGVYADGRPRAIHSYNKNVYVPNLGFVVAVQGNTYFSAQAGTAKTIIFNQDGDVSYFDGSYIHNGSGTSGMGACYDSNRHAIIAKATNISRFARFDLTTKQWAQFGSSSIQTSSYTALEFMPEHDAFLVMRNGFCYIADAGTGDWQQIDFTGSLVGMSLLGRAQPRYLGGNQFAVWDNSTNTTAINILSFSSDPFADTWHISQLPLSPENAVTPTVRQAEGTYGRFFHSPKLGILGVINAVNQPIYFYRYK